ncbi:MAG: hypothetical protein K0S44_3214 [Bacteroidetes bacterium]|jgi:hypothetical protein|nr:hypothetical protein [Bacteroidota bacterium]
MRNGFILSLLLTIILSSCTKDKGQVPFQVNDRSVFDLVLQTAGSGYYQSGAVLPGAGNSPHGSFKLRMNNVAQRILNSAGELPAGGAVFPDSSLIVKEIQSPGEIQYAVMYKNGRSWAWAEFRGDGKAIYTITANGASCISCHSVTPNRDLVRTFDLH